MTDRYPQSLRLGIAEKKLSTLRTIKNSNNPSPKIVRPATPDGQCA